MRTPQVFFDQVIGCGSSTSATGERLYITQKISQMTMPLFEGVESDELERFLTTCRRMNLQAVSRRMSRLQNDDPDVPPEALHFLVNMNYAAQDGRETRIVLVTHVTAIDDSAHELSIALHDAEEVDAYLNDLHYAQ
ncbi:hypothetical protein ANRL2_04643 [Anaerolineae bacterium]|nr:hypothetical protein ANRL2_04643 [Anaerolineae bacterium]